MSTDAQATETPSERRRLQQREEARRAILEATEALLIADGYEALSMRRVADRCGYTAPTIYHHFGDKAGLIQALLDEHFSELLERVEALPRDGDPIDRLRAQLEAFLRFGLETPNLYRLLELRPSETEPPESAERARAVMEEPLVELIRAEKLETDDIELAQQSIWMMLHGLVAMQINRPEHEWSPDLDEFALEVLLRGLVKPNAERNRT